VLGILSDAHGNDEAFHLAISVLERHGATEFAYLGDAVGYVPLPDVVNSLMRLDRLKLCIRGNHEDMLLNLNSQPKRDEVYQLQRTRKLLSESALEYLASWPVNHSIDFPLGKALFVHGSPSDPTNGYVYPNSDLSGFQTDADFVFMGHSHHPFIRRCGDKTYVNVGSCGMPRDDGRYGAAGLFDEHTGAIRVLRFDIAGATESVLTRSAPIHNSVAALFDRRRHAIFGEMDEPCAT
jgi:putative phosphoesterase